METFWVSPNSLLACQINIWIAIPRTNKTDMKLENRPPWIIFSSLKATEHPNGSRWFEDFIPSLFQPRIFNFHGRRSNLRILKKWKSHMAHILCDLQLSNCYVKSESFLWGISWQTSSQVVNRCQSLLFRRNHVEINQVGFNNCSCSTNIPY